MSIANFAPLWPRRSHACMVAGLTGNLTGLVTTRPFRVPPQTISEVGLIGGGHIPLPGEVALAHHGMRFLDERLAFRRHVLVILRQPLEDAAVTIARTSLSVTFQERLILAGAVNPFEVPPMLYRNLASAMPEDASAQLQARVNTTRTLQQRYAAEGQFCNAHMLPE